ncbi:scavenger receptor cysteine-rich type 1 protein M130-like [Asterias amurensis]|uniref:scavenger receptor cysteine-rich type 1 protein M130-like n=1 Tax=Asterias amurensis TaxID=7602 RepID=UPI003AB6C03D
MGAALLLRHIINYSNPLLTGTYVNGDIRLTGHGEARHYGRVEVFMEGQWGLVCRDRWDLADTDVLCRQLGYPAALAFFVPDILPESSNLEFLLSDFNCNGDEQSLLECDHSGLDDWIFCFRFDVTGVICDAPGYPEGQLELFGFNVDYAGIIKMQMAGVWGSFCANDWSISEATVVCRQLGYPMALVSLTRSQYENDTSLYDGTEYFQFAPQCQGNESRLIDCSFKNIFPQCSFFKTSGVVCSTNDTGDAKPTIDIRLVDGQNEQSGRVEINVGGLWGSICDTDWDMADAMVICRHFGWKASRAVPEANFLQGSGPILLDRLGCFGNESSILDCEHRGLGINNCRHYQDASVICTPNETTYDFRLVPTQETKSSGRLEYMISGVWGRICSLYWDEFDTAVACRHFGFKSGYAVQWGTVFPVMGHVPILIDYLTCNGTETSLFDCGKVEDNIYCTNEEDIGVICSASDTPPPWPLRLVGGPSNASGTLEAKVNSVWFTICHQGWDIRDANVACRQLGFQGASGAMWSAAFGPGTGRILLNEVNCKGDESNLLDCNLGVIGNNLFTCGQNEDAGVICSSSIGSSATSLRLVNGSTDGSSGRLEVNIEGVWGTVCSNSWDMDDARVVCRQLGYPSAVRATRDASFGEGSGFVLLNEVECSGKEKHLLECPQSDPGANRCRHRSDAGVVCTSTVRLENGDADSNGRVEIKVDGVWGTVCDHDWDLKDADVVCREMGFPSAVWAPKDAWYGQGDGPVHKTRLACTGDELSLTECPFSTATGEDCPHGRDAGVVCSAEEDGLSASQRLIRLIDGEESASGFVNMYRNGKWFYVLTGFGDTFDLEVAHIACRQAGYSSALSAETQDVDTEIPFAFITCYENAAILQDCHVHLTSLLTAPMGWVVCETNVTSIGDVPFRLVEGTTTGNSSGRVELRVNGQWGTVCQDDWDISDATVICRQLGFQAATAIVLNAGFGPGNGPIFMDDVQCDGSESSLLDCQLGQHLGSHDCWHSKDTGVVCTDEDGNGHYVECMTNCSDPLVVYPNSTSYLDIAGRSSIPVVSAGDFKRFFTLQYIDLSRTSMQTLEAGCFDGLTNLYSLRLDVNDISALNYGAFNDLKYTLLLNLTNNSITTIDNGAFDGLSSLVVLFLRNNKITRLHRYGLTGMPRLAHLFLEGNSFQTLDQDAFQDLPNLQKVYADDRSLCCLLAEGSSAECVVAKPQSAFFTCNRLLPKKVMVGIIWFQAIAAVFGNLAVIGWRKKHFKEGRGQVQSLLILNLAASDFLMGVYLMIIAGADVFYGNEFYLFASQWRTGLACQIAGTLSILSSEASVFFITLISIDRLLGVAFPFSKHRLTVRSTYIVSCCLWSFALALSLASNILAALGYSELYDLSNVCVTFPLSRQPARYVTQTEVLPIPYGAEGIEIDHLVQDGSKPIGYLAIGIFLVLNLISFFVVAVCYVIIFVKARGSSRKAGRNVEMSEEIRMATKMAILVVTDLICWMPIIIMGVLAQAGAVTIPLELYAWAVAVFLPINSSINPILYTVLQYLLSRSKKAKAKRSGSSGGRISTISTDTKNSSMSVTK